jgi:hypothetical protein
MISSQSRASSDAAHRSTAATESRAKASARSSSTVAFLRAAASFSSGPDVADDSAFGFSTRESSADAFGGFVCQLSEARRRRRGGFAASHRADEIQKRFGARAGTATRPRGRFESDSFVGRRRGGVVVVARLRGANRVARVTRRRQRHRRPERVVVVVILFARRLRARQQSLRARGARRRERVKRVVGFRRVVVYGQTL